MHSHVVDTVAVPKFEYAEPVASCPKHYTMIDGVCVKGHKSEPSMKCEQGHMNKDGMCYQEMKEKAMENCPSGYELTKGGKCVSVELIAEQLYCKEGELFDGVCISNKKSEPKMYCPKDSKLEAGMCISSVKTEAIEVCEYGYELVKGKCIRYEHSEPVRQCPLDFEPSGDLCVKYSIPDIQCPKGFKYNKGDNTCMKTVKGYSSYACPDGYVAKGKKCESSYDYPAIPVCKDGWMYNEESDTCFKIVEETPMGQCEEGDHFDKGRCTSKKEGKATQFCLSGALNNKGECVDYIIEASRIGCPKESELVDGRCAIYSNQTVTCEYGYLEKDGSICSAELSTKSELECEVGDLKGKYCYSGFGELPVLMCPEGSVQIGQECEYPGSLPSVKCPKHYKPAVGGGCSRSISTDSTPFCHYDMRLSGKMCYKEAEYIPEYFCKSGVLVDGHCLDTTKAKPKMNCPKGFKLDSKSSACKRHVKEEKEVKAEVPKKKKSNSVEDMHGKKKSSKKDEPKKEDSKLKVVKQKAEKVKDEHYKKAPKTKEPKKKASEGHHGHH